MEKKLANGRFSDEENDRLKQIYLRQNRMEFCGMLVVRAVLMIVSLTIVAAFCSAILDHVPGGYLPAGIKNCLQNGLAVGTGGGVMFWVARWDDRKRFQRFLDALPTEQVADAKEPEASQSPR